MSASKILIVDDEERMRALLERLVRRLGHRADTAGDYPSALAKLRENTYELFITDVRMPGGDGLSLLKEARALDPDIAVVVMTAFGSIPDAVGAMRAGAFDYLEKPFEMETMELLMERALQGRRVARDRDYLLGAVDEESGFGEMVGSSEAIRGPREHIVLAARTRSTVLIRGESGTGKELAARALHRLSVDRDRPLIKVNCAAIPEQLIESELFGHVKGSYTGATGNRVGKFALADQGSIFLDEIGYLPMALQAKLLRVLQEREFEPLGSSELVQVDCRVIAATSVDLEGAVRAGSFREDLFYRINVIPVHLPPLRERLEDLPELVRAILSKLERKLAVRAPEPDPEVLEAFHEYAWPGNVRELENVLERVVVLNPGPRLQLSHLPREIVEASPVPLPEGQSDFRSQVETFEAGLIQASLRETGGRKKEAAERLGITPRNLSYYLSKYKMS